MSKFIIEDVVFCRWISSVLGCQKALFTDALQVIGMMRFTFLSLKLSPFVTVIIILNFKCYTIY